MHHIVRPETEGLEEMLSRRQKARPDLQAPGHLSPFNLVVEAGLNTPPLATALRGPPEEPNQQLPHCQLGDQGCHRLPLSEPGQTLVQSRPRRAPQSEPQPERGTSRSSPPPRLVRSPAQPRAPPWILFLLGSNPRAVTGYAAP